MALRTRRRREPLRLHRPALLARRQELMHSSAALVSTDTKVLYSSLSALLQQYPEGDALRHLVVDDLTGLPVQFETVDLGGDELALVEAIAAGAPGGGFKTG